MCLDGLSLDRHRSFQQKLAKLPISFCKAHEQALIFRKSLDRVIEIPGPLHQEFHLLQCIFNVFYYFFKTSAKVIGWKKINYAYVSQSFHMCRQLVQIVFEECSRIAWDPFLHKKKNEIENQMQTTPNNESFAMSLSSAFQ